MRYTRRLFDAVVYVLALVVPSLGAAQSGFAGVSASGLYVDDVTDNIGGLTLGFIGAQVGSYDLLSPLGGRITVEASVTPTTGFLSGSADLLFASSGDVKVYGGAGVGIINLLVVSTSFAKAFLGLDFNVGSSVSLFVEAAPLYAFETGNTFLGGKFGVNFGFGDTSQGVSGVQGTCCTIP